MKATRRILRQKTAAAVTYIGRMRWAGLIWIGSRGTGDVFFTRCRVLPANTISTRFNLHRHLAKSLRSAGQIVRLPHPVSSTDRPIDFGSARSPLLCSCSAAQRGVSPTSMCSYQHLPIRHARGQRIQRSSGAYGCSKDRCVELLTHPRPT